MQQNGISRQIALADGRLLGFAEYGDQDDLPIIYCHGAPGARTDWFIFGDEAWARQHGARFIAVDRPGTGLSDFLPGRTIGDWPGDVSQLADALGLDRFGVWGLSGGGPYAAVCAALLPDRVTGAVVVSGVGPFSELPEAYPLIPQGSRIYWTITRKNAVLARLFLRFMKFMASRSVERMGENMARSLPPVDQVYMADIQQLLADVLLEALRSGARGPQHDAWLIQQPWDFELEAIRVPVFLWHGEADRSVPSLMGRYVAERIPGCQSQFVPEEGHISLVKKYRDEMIGPLLGDLEGYGRVRGEFQINGDK